MSVCVYIGIVYIVPTIGGLYVVYKLFGVQSKGVICSRGGKMSVGVCIGIVYIMPKIGGVVCKLFFALILFISCQRLRGI